MPIVEVLYESRSASVNRLQVQRVLEIIVPSRAHVAWADAFLRLSETGVMEGLET